MYSLCLCVLNIFEVRFSRNVPVKVRYHHLLVACEDCSLVPLTKLLTLAAPTLYV